MERTSILLYGIERTSILLYGMEKTSILLYGMERTSILLYGMERTSILLSFSKLHTKRNHPTKFRNPSPTSSNNYICGAEVPVGKLTVA